jgi:hypothetical protein
VIASVLAAPCPGDAFEFTSESEVAVTPDDVVLDAAAEDARGGIWSSDTRAPEAPDSFLRRGTSPGNGAFTVFGDRVRAIVKRSRSSDPTLGVTDHGAAGVTDGAQWYWLEADLFRHSDIGLSAYGAYRQAPSPLDAGPFDAVDRDSATAGLSLGIGGWRSWLERRESPDDPAMSHFANATRMLTYSTGLALGSPLPLANSERLKIGVSRSVPTAQFGDAAETPVEYMGNESRQAVDLSLAHRWQIGTTRLQLGRALTGAPSSSDETESSVRLGHQIASGPWRGEAAVGLISTRDERPVDAFAWYAYELSAKIDYFAVGLPDLTARLARTEANREFLATDYMDVDATWQISGTVGFGKFLTGGVRRPGRFVDLKFSVRRDDATAAAIGDPIDASVGVSTGLRF